MLAYVDMNSLELFEMWSYGRILRISLASITNQEEWELVQMLNITALQIS